MKFAPGTWHNDPLPRYNKFSPDGGGGSAWRLLGRHAGDLHLPDRCPTTTSAHSLRDLGQYGVSTKSVIGHPAWKTAVEKTMPLRRVPEKDALGRLGRRAWADLHSVMRGNSVKRGERERGCSGGRVCVALCVGLVSSHEISRRIYQINYERGATSDRIRSARTLSSLER